LIFHRALYGFSNRGGCLLNRFDRRRSLFGRLVWLRTFHCRNSLLCRTRILGLFLSGFLQLADGLRTGVHRCFFRGFDGLIYLLSYFFRFGFHSLGDGFLNCLDGGVLGRNRRFGCFRNLAGNDITGRRRNLFDLLLNRGGCLLHFLFHRDSSF